jgi:hypothetical protein
MFPLLQAQPQLSLTLKYLADTKINMANIKRRGIPVILTVIASIILSGCSGLTSQDEIIPNQITTIDEALDVLNQNTGSNPDVDRGQNSVSDGSKSSGQQEAPANLIPPTTLVPSNPTIADYITFADFTDRAAQIFLITDPRAVTKEDLQTSCKGLNITATTNVLGCFVTPPSRIYVFDILDDRLVDAEAVIAAHEMLHAVWYLELNNKERSRLTGELESYYNKLPANHFLRARLALYADSPESIPTELHSILGTEAENLPASLETHYAKYFNDRKNVLRLARNSFRYIDSLAAEIKAKSESLANEKIGIDETRNNLRLRNDTLNRDVLEFNDRVNSGYYTDQPQYNADRDALNLRKDQLNGDFAAFEIRTTKYNNLVKEFNSLVALNNELNEAIKTS